MAPKRKKRPRTLSIQDGGPEKPGPLGLQPVVELPELNLFLRKELQVQIQEINDESILPTGILAENADIVFNIKGDVERFLDPSSIQLVIRAQLRNGDGTGIAAGMAAAPVANLAISLFSRVNVVLGNSTSITSNADSYPYVAYLDNVLRKSKEYGDQYNFVSFIWPDTQGKFDLTTDANLGFKQRKEQSKSSMDINLMCKIVSPITNQNRLVLPLIDMRFVLHPAESKFLVRSDVAAEQRNQKIVINEISMQYRKIRLNTGLHLAFMDAVVQVPAVYPYQWLKTFEFSKQLGIQTVRETIFSDSFLPTTVFLFGVSTDRRVGSYLTSPWLINFSNLTDVRLVSGTDSFPRIPFNPAVRKQFRMYLEAKKCLGSFAKSGADNGVNYTDYIDGYDIIAWDLSRSGNSQLPDMPRLANLELHMDYTAALTEATSFILVMEYNSNIYVKSVGDRTTAKNCISTNVNYSTTTKDQNVRPTMN